MFLEGGRSLPLGVGLGGYTDAFAEVPGGALVVLYTDGAIEQRGEAFDHGLTGSSPRRRRFVGSPPKRRRGACSSCCSVVASRRTTSRC